MNCIFCLNECIYYNQYSVKCQNHKNTIIYYYPNMEKFEHYVIEGTNYRVYRLSRDDSYIYFIDEFCTWGCNELFCFEYDPKITPDNLEEKVKMLLVLS